MPYSLMGYTPKGNACELEYVVRVKADSLRLAVRECDDHGEYVGPIKLIDVREKDFLCWIGQVLTEIAITRE